MYASRVALALLGLAFCGCAPSGEPIDRRSAPIINGSPVLGDTAAVALTSTSGQIFCSGTLISSKVVLTAGHCVYGVTSGKVFFGESTHRTGGQFVETAGFYPHPDYDDVDFRRADIGLVVLRDRALLQPIAPSNIPMTDAWGDREVRVVGFGYQEIGATGDIGDKYQVTVPIEWVSPKEFGRNVSTCQGDSGGPAFMTFEDGVERIVGITSWGRGDPACSGDEGSARVDIYDGWITSMVDELDPVSCQQDFRCATGCPEADPDCPCSSTDGFCSELCTDTDTDPDCPKGCGENGACIDGCPAPDPDCGDPCGAEGHCLTACPARDPDCPAPVAPGAACTSDFDCGDAALCVSPPGGGARVCTQECTPGAQDACGDGAECRTIGVGRSVCEAAADGGGGGCVVATTRDRRSGMATLLALLVAAAGLLPRARRR